MVDRAYGMESAVPAKRPRLDFPENTSSQQYDGDFRCFAGTSELLTGSYSNGTEFTLTSDSGFNELTPPQSLEDDIPAPNGSGPGDGGGGGGGTSVAAQLSSDNTDDNTATDTTDTSWQNSVTPAREEEEEEEDEDEEDRQSVASTASNLSGLSDLSNLSGKDWKPCAGPMSWVQQQMLRGVNPRTILTHVLGATTEIPEGVADVTLWRLILNVLSEPPRREKLRHINTIEDVVRLMRSCRKIIVLTGAGVSVSCGIPDFRSRDGIYARLAVDFPDLPDPQAMFDIHYFRRDPRPFFKFAREIYPGQFTPSLCHRFIRLIEQHNKLLRNYTQNIDTLEQVAGINNVIQCHGSFATATCQTCGHKVNAQAIKEDIFSQHIPKCSICSVGEEETTMETTTPNTTAPDTTAPNTTAPDTTNAKEKEEEKEKERDKGPENYLASQTNEVGSKEEKEGATSEMETKKPSEDEMEEGNSSSSHEMPQDPGLHLMHHRPPDSPQLPPQPIMKPDIVFFGEGLPDEFHDKMAEDKDQCDLLIVIGSSLKVRPVALIPSSLPPEVPQILINREPLRHLTFDVELLGDCDIIINELCNRLDNRWKDLCSVEGMTEIRELPPRPLPPNPSTAGTSVDDGATCQAASLVAPQHAPHPRDESDIEALRACWAPKIRETVASRLPDNMFLHTGGHKYIFPGAEVYYDPDDEFEETKSATSDSDTDELEEARDESQESFNANHPRLDEDLSSAETPHLSPEDVDSLLSAADNGQSHEPVEDWTSLNASLDTSLDCDHTLTGFETDQHGESIAHQSDNLDPQMDSQAHRQNNNTAHQNNNTPPTDSASHQTKIISFHSNATTHQTESNNKTPSDNTNTAHENKNTPQTVSNSPGDSRAQEGSSQGKERSSEVSETTSNSFSLPSHL